MGAIDRDLARMREEIDRMTETLHKVVAQQCPSIQGHNPRQHRDRKPPWCEGCGRTADGVQIKDIGGLP